MLTIDEAMWLEQVAKSCTTTKQARLWRNFVIKQQLRAPYGSAAELKCVEILAQGWTTM